MKERRTVQDECKCRKQLKALIASGMTASAAAKRLGIHNATAMKILGVIHATQPEAVVTNPSAGGPKVSGTLADGLREWFASHYCLGFKYADSMNRLRSAARVIWHEVKAEIDETSPDDLEAALDFFAPFDDDYYE